MPEVINRYLEAARDAQERAKTTTDPDLRARWLGVAFGYRELARFRRQSRNRVSELPPASPISQQRPNSRTP
jgi:hypothetical protein